MKPKLIILGAAPCLEADLAFLEQKFGKRFLLNESDFMAIGVDAVGRGCLLVQYVATYHPEDIPLIKDKMRGLAGYKIISHVENGTRDINNRLVDGIDIIVPYDPPSGSSALLGALGGIQLGYKKIILCGCPLEGMSKNQPKESYLSFHKGWQVKRNKVIDYIRSVSGWTKDFLGAPDEEWLNG